jgi:hypothetical protein
MPPAAPGEVGRPATNPDFEGRFAESIQEAMR